MQGVVKDRRLGRRRRNPNAVSNTPEYHAWRAMIARCEKPEHPNFGDYGARGIAVCDRWHTFAAFLQDMGPRPSGRSLERVDNDLGYGPENCRWATWSEQMANRRPELNHNSKKTECKHGHPFSPENTMITSSGRRVCKACRSRFQRDRRSRRFAERTS